VALRELLRERSVTRAAERLGVTQPAASAALSRLRRHLDGMLCLASCDKTAPGQLMAAARLNIPSVIVACGYQPSGTYRGRHCDIEDVFLAAGHVANGKLTVAELTEMSEHAVLGPGVCAGMGTATMHLACEALGMAVPGTTPVRANSEAMWQAVEQAARRVVEMTAEDLRPRDILTRAPSPTR
jgi:dihydroxy-acid dehydratase